MARALGLGWGFLLCAGLLVAAPARAHDHRTDRCGCHHQYGLRHCHPNKKSQGCEAPASARVKEAAKPPAKAKAATEVRTDTGTKL